MSKSRPPPTENQKAPVTGKTHLFLDPWNTSSSGHQVSDSNPGTAWRRTREAKLAQQFTTGDCTVNSLVYKSGGRSYERGEWEWDWGGDARGGRGHDGRSGRSHNLNNGGEDPKQMDIRSMMRVKKPVSGSGLGPPLHGKEEKEKDTSGKGKKVESGESGEITFLSPDIASVSASQPELDLEPGPVVFGPRTEQDHVSKPDVNTQLQPQPQAQPPTQQSKSGIPSGTESTILRGATVYINGQTAPMVSDHKLKGLLVAHGATLALSHSRRITHVIIGKPNAGPGRGGAGGGLAAGKLQKEISRGGWKGVKIVGVEWVLESIKAGKRLPETRFAVNLSNQRSVLSFM
ncbi:hypothetical protein BJX99DRAFT_62556 [Aspergillus californicus]